MKKRYLLLSCFLITAFLTLISRSGGPGTLLQQQVTGAPGETTCASCHSGGNGGGKLDISIPGFSGAIVPGKNYEIEVTLSDPDGLVGGMQIVALDANLQSVGTFLAAPRTQLVTLNGRQYLEHSTPKLFDFTNTPYNTSWTINWIAPIINPGQVVFFASGVAADWTGTNNQDDVYTTQTTMATLPVEWAGFEGLVGEGGEVLLQWATSREINTEFFEVQRSLDGDFYESVGQLPAQGNSEGIISYRFVDRPPLFEQDYLYRIRQVDKDGAYQFSEVLTLWLPALTFSLSQPYPNPAIGQSTIKAEVFLPKASTYEVKLRSQKGRSLVGLLQAGEAGRNLVEMPVDQIPSGIYYLEVSYEKTQLHRRLVVAN